MKSKHLLVLLLSFNLTLFSQEEKVVEEITKNFSKNSFFLEGGANIPAFGWGSDYGYAKTGFEVGVGWDYYFLQRWGLGLDLRMHQNGLSRKENTVDLSESNIYNNPSYTATTSQSTSEKWKGYSIAVGPSYRIPLFNDKFVFEAYLKGGVAFYKLPTINATYAIEGNGAGPFTTTIINGYYDETVEDKSTVAPIGISGLRFGYNLTDNWMVYGTVNYKTTLINRNNFSYDYDRTIEGAFIPEADLAESAIEEGVTIDGTLVDKTGGAFGFEQESIKANGSIQSWGALVGIKYTPSFIKKPKKKKEEVSDLLKRVDTVVVVKTDTVEIKKTNIVVTVKDAPSQVIIPNAEVALIDEKGNIVTTGKSDAFGIATFENVSPGNYTTKAMVYGKSTTIANITKNEFEAPLINKEVLYEDIEFILLGKTMNIDTKTTIPEVLVSLENKTQKGLKQGTSDNVGAFNFGLSPETEYQVYGNKNGLFTNTNKVSTVGLKRSQTLFVELELGLQNPCGKEIKLNNIYYDLNKSFIREEAKIELNRVVNFMKNNPEVMIELSSHTDCRASNKYNKSLSQRRASAAVTYIISQGADKTKIKGIGYGETKLLNKCADGVKCSEDEHQLNRRTEVKVICL